MGKKKPCIIQKKRDGMFFERDFGFGLIKEMIRNVGIDRSHESIKSIQRTIRYQDFQNYSPNQQTFFPIANYFQKVNKIEKKKLFFYLRE